MTTVTKPVQEDLETILVLDRDDEILIDMERILRERGWFQGSLDGRGGSVCMMGALNLAVTGSLIPLRPIDLATRARIYDKIKGVLISRGLNVTVPDWNDRVATNVDEVYELLREARTSHVAQEET